MGLKLYPVKRVDMMMATNLTSSWVVGITDINWILVGKFLEIEEEVDRVSEILLGCKGKY